MAFWNFTHNILHMHVYLLPSIALGVGMTLTGLLHHRKQKNRNEDYEKELRGETPEAPKQ